MTDKKPTILMVDVQLKSFIEARRPKDEELLKQLDFGYSWNGQTALLFEIRPQWNDPGHFLHIEFAKLRYVKSSKLWKLYWKRASGNWEAYEPKAESSHLYELLNEIGNDRHSCFFG